jgi:hypothetical protein
MFNPHIISAYGLVLRMQSDLLVSSLVDGAQPSGGEWHSLEFSNRLLSMCTRDLILLSTDMIGRPQVIGSGYGNDLM